MNADNTTPRDCYQYAKDTIKGRWPEGEQIIATNSAYAYLYAKYVIKGRFPEAESTIKTDSFSAYYYAKYVIKHRWPDAETIIATDPSYAYMYCILFSIKPSQLYNPNNIIKHVDVLTTI